MSESSGARFLALIGALNGDRRVTHTAGYPLDASKLLPLPDVVLIVSDDTGRAMLFRYTAYGEFGGDTWHASTTDAEAQAVEEYGEALGNWVEVPADITDAHGYAVQYANERLNDRGNW